jgi:hypothetical protein
MPSKTDSVKNKKNINARGRVVRLYDRMIRRDECEPNEGSVGASMAYSRAQLDAALALANRGLAIFPCFEPVTYGDQVECSCKEHEKCAHIGKHPRTKHGFKDASKDPDQIKRWWSESPNANTAIATGDRFESVGTRCR